MKTLITAVLATLTIASVNAYTINGTDYDGYWKENKYCLNDGSGCFKFWKTYEKQESYKVEKTGTTTTCETNEEKKKRAIEILQSLTIQCIGEKEELELLQIVSQLTKEIKKDTFENVKKEELKEVEKSEFIKSETKVITRTKTVYRLPVTGASK